eukprot:scaffold4749_cov137-Isochrysis_galbana.AAC.1
MAGGFSSRLVAGRATDSSGMGTATSQLLTPSGSIDGNRLTKGEAELSASSRGSGLAAASAATCAMTCRCRGCDLAWLHDMAERGAPAHLHHHKCEARVQRCEFLLAARVGLPNSRARHAVPWGAQVHQSGGATPLSPQRVGVCCRAAAKCERHLAVQPRGLSALAIGCTALEFTVARLVCRPRRTVVIQGPVGTPLASLCTHVIEAVVGIPDSMPLSHVLSARRGGWSDNRAATALAMQPLAWHRTAGPRRILRHKTPPSKPPRRHQRDGSVISSSFDRSAVVNDEMRDQEGGARMAACSLRRPWLPTPAVATWDSGVPLIPHEGGLGLAPRLVQHRWIACGRCDDAITSVLESHVLKG